MEEYNCKHCEGVSRIVMLKDIEKATEPTIEFCPFCGMSNQYSKEIESNQKWTKDQSNGVWRGEGTKIL